MGKKRSYLGVVGISDELLVAMQRAPGKAIRAWVAFDYACVVLTGVSVAIGGTTFLAHGKRGHEYVPEWLAYESLAVVDSRAAAVAIYVATLVFGLRCVVAVAVEKITIDLVRARENGGRFGLPTALWAAVMTLIFASVLGGLYVAGMGIMRHYGAPPWLEAAVVFAFLLMLRTYRFAIATIRRTGVAVEGAPKITGVPQVVRGRAFWPLHAMRQALDQWMEKAGAPYGEQKVAFGGLEIPELMMAPHTVVVGGTGAGKTLTIQMLVRTALFTPGGKLRKRMVTHDVKGDQEAFMRRHGATEEQLLICNPGRNDGAAWDVAADVRDAEDARQLAAMLCPKDAKSTSPYFSEVAQQLLYEVIKALQKTAPGAWMLRDVVLATTEREVLQAALQRTDSGRAAWRTHCEQNSQQTAGSILSTLANKLANFSHVAARWSQAPKRFSLRRFLRDDPRVLVLVNREHRSESVSPIYRAMLRFLAEQVLALPEKHEFEDTWFILDEINSLGAFEKLDKMMTQSRSKGGHVVIGYQDLDAMATVWGLEQTRALTGLCMNVACLRVGSPTTAKHFTETFGSYKFPEVSVTQSWGYKSDSRSQTTANKTEAAAIESELMGIPMADSKHGLHGRYLTTMVGMWCGQTSAGTVRKLLPVAKGDEVSKEDDAAMDLASWSEDDRRRLGWNIAPREVGDSGAMDRPRGIPEDIQGDGGEALA